MFNTHEMPIFQRVGLTPVFFGQTLVGASLPNLTYMLVFPDDAARKAAWGRFGADDDWKKLKAMPEYADRKSSRRSPTRFSSRKATRRFELSESGPAR
ncbi:MAG: NIPSNAP family protein [Chthoniobacter sp.]